MTNPILVVDDEPTNLATLRQILSPEYPLVFARSGSEALTAVAKHNPSLILLDVMMPDMDGYTVCRKLKADPLTENIPVIFVTSLAEVGDETAGFTAGAVDYIIKPVSPPIVKARVHTHLSLVNSKQLEQSYHEAIYMLGVASEFRDTDTGYSHLENGCLQQSFSCGLRMG
ncbi:MAG: response regulator [Methylococcales bacterium]|nr:response regulator [Methylococcales bacterium]